MGCLGPLRFLLMVNKQGHTRLAKYFRSELPKVDKTLLEGSLVRKCVRQNSGAAFLDFEEYKVIFRRYASLFFIIGVDRKDDVNEILLLEFLHGFVETLDKQFRSVCELDIMFNIEKVYFILEEMVSPQGDILDCNRNQVLLPINYMDREEQSIMKDANQLSASTVVSGVKDKVTSVVDSYIIKM